MQTPDGAWRVEVVRRGRSRWYRVVHGGDFIDCLAIAAVHRVLTDAGIDLADLVDVGETAAEDHGEVAWATTCSRDKGELLDGAARRRVEQVGHAAPVPRSPYPPLSSAGPGVSTGYAVARRRLTQPWAV